MPDQYPYYAKKVLHDLTGTRGYNPGYLQGEVDEFVEAFKAKRAKEVEEELQDVMFGAQMLAHQVSKRDAPVLGADDKIREFYRRKNYYEKMFKDRDVPFSTDYLAGGSNPLKPHKIQAAFDLAGQPIDEPAAAAYSKQYPSFKGASYGGEEMPFKSDAQRRYFHWAESKGKLPKGTTAKWQSETPKRDLPERVNKKADMTKVSYVPDLDGLRKLAGDVYDWDRWKSRAQAKYRKRHPLGGAEIHEFPGTRQRQMRKVNKNLGVGLGKLKIRDKYHALGALGVLAALGLTANEIREYKKKQKA